MKRTSRALELVVALFLVVELASNAGATPFSLSRVADTSTAIPNGTGHFTGFPSHVISGGNVAFAACGTGVCDQDQGIYLFNGATLSRAADIATAIPNGTGNFTHVFSPVISGSDVAFLADGSSGQRGIYLFDGTMLSRVADLNTAVPSGTGTFTGVGSPVISGGNVAFLGGGSSGQRGIYLFDGTMLSRVADLDTAIPSGTGTFTDLFEPVISGGKVAFRGFGARQDGIYLFDGVTLSRVADRNTAIPSGAGNFMFLVQPVISGGNVAFRGFSASFDQEGIYLFDGTTLSRVADFNTSVPNGTGAFVSFDPPVISGGNVAFHAFVGANFGQEGIYLFDGITLSRAADSNTRIPHGGRNFSLVSNPAISGSAVAFFGCGGPCDHGGIYLFDGTTLSRVADQNTPIPNRTGRFTGVALPTISGGHIAFIGFGVRHQGLYLARVQAIVHDLAVVRITAPTTVTQGSGAQSVTVQIQNRSDHGEVITAANLGDGVTAGLVRLDVSPVGVDDDAENCQPAMVTLDAAKNAALFPNGSKTLGREAKLTINFRVTYSCLAAKPKKLSDSTPGDYRHVATVFHSELGAPDDHPADDTCPRDALPSGIDPFPDGTIRDKGCGAREPDATFGNPVLTDVVAK